MNIEILKYIKTKIKENKHEENDYGSRAALYTMGYMAKLFKKGTRVLESSWDDNFIRCCGVTCPNGSVSIAIINWEGKEKTVSVDLEHNLDKPMRKYEYIAEHQFIVESVQDISRIISYGLFVIVGLISSITRI